MRGEASFVLGFFSYFFVPACTKPFRQRQAKTKKYKERKFAAAWVTDEMSVFLSF
jgi:hypothetical protein